ncbi:multidrug resistance protein 1 [Mucor ambiguus]|uniref:Multidrug resistance protein 1 n=1 Tax=Mucor ambiguus TaxID=91626 RepID=A0A0C9LSA3_9FUNG|nr:multidrug resistance protein 1 [Mucor ambiguus]
MKIPLFRHDAKTTTAAHTKDNKKPKVSFIQLFRFSTRVELSIIIIAATLSAISGVLPPLAILIYGSYITKIVNAQGNEAVLTSIMPTIRLMLIMGTAAIITTYISTCLWIRMGERQVRRIRALYLHSILEQDMAWFDTAKDNSFLTRLASDTQLIQDGISERLGFCISFCCQFLAGFLVGFYKGYKMALTMFSVCPLLIAIMLTMIVMIKKYAIQTQTSYTQAGAVAEQALQAIRTVYAFSLQERFLQRFQEKLKVAERFGTKRIYVTGVGFAVFTFCFYSSLGLALWYASQLVLERTSTASSVFVVFLAMITGSISMARMLPHLTAIANACGASYSIFKVIDTVPTIQCNHHGGEKPAHVDGTIEFKHVNFAYASRPDALILHDLSLTIHAGMTVACVGQSGSGKSTLVQLLQRFYDPKDGQITLDGRDVKGLNVQWLRQSIGVVNQQPVLFNTTIRENIKMGSPVPVSDAGIIAAAKEANCHHFVMKLPQGYNTSVGEHGDMLSGGQRQRIAIARAIVKNPSILLLDEATSALDTQSERLVQNALDKASANRTTIIIAHRLSTVAKADKIVVLDNGSIVETGTHQELIRLNQRYADLVRKQSIDPNEEEQQDTLSIDEEIDHEISDVELKTDGRSQLHSDLTKVNTIDSAGSTDVSVISDIYAKASDYDEKKTIIHVEDNNTKHCTQHSSTWSVVKRMRQEWWLILLGVCGALIHGTILPLYAYTFSSVIGILSDPNYQKAPPLQGTNLYAFIFFIIGVASFVGGGLNKICLPLSGEYFTHRLRGQIFEAYMKQDIEFFDKKEHNTGILTTRLATDAQSVSDMVSKVWGDVVGLSATLTTGLIIAFMHSWALTLITMSMLPLIVLSTTFDMYLQRSFDDKTKNDTIASSQVAGEAIREVRTVAALCKQAYFEERYAEATERSHQLAIRKAYFSSIGFAFHRGIIIYTNALAFYFGTQLLVNGSIEFRQLFTSMTVLILTAESAARNSMFATVLAKGKEATRTIFDLLDPVCSSRIESGLEGAEPEAGTLKGNVRYDGVKFAYPARQDDLVFDGSFDLDISSGQNVALVGPSGSGKSTIIGLLQRWYDVTEGSVSLDSRNVKSYSVHNLRSHMSVIGQEPILFNVSIAENIRYGVHDNETHVTQQDVEDVAKAANIHDFVTSLPQGYDTLVGVKGSQLSGGQKQRIGIARAILRKPRVLLLDEATSALDSESERLVQEALDQIIQQGTQTTITIAHRLSTVVNADVICVLKNGKIKEQGTHRELLALNGVYSRLVAEQSLK